MRRMKIVALSDTHVVPRCDLLIHAGDFSGRGRVEDTVDFLQWFERQPAKHRVLIAGNHDLFAEAHAAEFSRMLRAYEIAHLHDSGIEIDGLKIWGSPYTPKFFDWAFMRERGEAIRAHWDLIPEDTDILITHGPPLGRGDRNDKGEFCGCADLLKRVEVVKPRLHIFGHIHEGRGEYRWHGQRTRFVNAANIGPIAGSRVMLRQPVEIELDPEKAQDI